MVEREFIGGSMPEEKRSEEYRPQINRKASPKEMGPNAFPLVAPIEQSSSGFKQIVELIQISPAAEQRRFNSMQLDLGVMRNALDQSNWDATPDSFHRFYQVVIMHIRNPIIRLADCEQLIALVEEGSQLFSRYRGSDNSISWKLMNLVEIKSALEEKITQATSHEESEEPEEAPDIESKKTEVIGNEAVAAPNSGESPVLDEQIKSYKAQLIEIINNFGENRSFSSDLSIVSGIVRVLIEHYPKERKEELIHLLHQTLEWINTKNKVRVTHAQVIDEMIERLKNVLLAAVKTES